MSIETDVSDFIRERALVEIARGRKDERLYSPDVQFSRMGIGEEGAIWIAAEIENQFGINLLPLIKRDPIGLCLYKKLKPEDITNYIIRRVH